MDIKESATKFLRKESIAFKRNSLKESKKLLTGLSDILADNQYCPVDISTCSQFQFSALNERALFKDFRVDTKVVSLALEGEKCDALLRIDSSKVEYDMLLIVIPDIWLYCGGFVLSAENFFVNFDRLSYLLDDDYRIFSLENKLSFFKFNGERTGDRLSCCDISRSGKEFSRLLKS